jgi:hypothetical protein
VELGREAATHKQVFCIESDNNSDLLSSKNGLKIIEQRFRGNSVVGGQIAGVEDYWDPEDEEGGEVARDNRLLNRIQEEDLALMNESDKKVYVEQMRAMIAKRLQVYRRAASYLKQVSISKIYGYRLNVKKGL